MGTSRTLGGAIATAQPLPGTVGADLVSAARDAFSEGFEITAMVGAVVALAMAIIAAVVLRRGVETRSEEDTLRAAS